MRILQWACCHVRKVAIGLMLLLTLPAMAAAQSRTVTLTWVASTSSAVTAYNVYSCTVVSPATSCTPVVSGTPLATVTAPTARFKSDRMIGSKHTNSTHEGPPSRFIVIYKSIRRQLKAPQKTTMMSFVGGGGCGGTGT
ncbi:MAG: hypothetical protein ABR921_15140 [Candidatus Sulfotelmatobacter sp.]|jgi:hypothetical protein